MSLATVGQTAKHDSVPHIASITSTTAIEVRDGATLPATISEARVWARNDDGKSPYDWSKPRKTGVFVILMMTILNSCLGSSLTSNAIPFIALEFSVESQTQKALPMSCYLIGYVFGPLLWAPASEQFGRRYITIGSFFGFSIFTMACALAPAWGPFLAFRSFAGISASGPIAVAPGILADIYQDQRARGRAVAVYMVVTAFGPLLGPILSGFVCPALDWRWSFWIALMFAGGTLVPLFFLPETSRAVLLARHGGGSQPSKTLPSRSLHTVLFRPLYMLIFEPIVTTSSAYLALCYAIFYMSFQAYPVIFQGVYGLSPGICGLTYLPIGAGSLIFLPVFWLYDRYLAHQAQDTSTQALPKNREEEYRRLPLACLGGPLFALSLFWLGWSARESVPFAIPMLAGIPFGFGFICIFIALL
ncbi:major facilitator superfamily domain-containing protein, partial [Aspergillus carlsbadensis]